MDRLSPLEYMLALAAVISVGLSCADNGIAPENRPPAITSSVAVEALTDSLFSYTVHASDPDGDALTIEIVDIPSWTSVSGTVISGTPTAQTPDTSFMAIASDGFLSDTAMVSVSIVTQISPVSYSGDIQPIFNSNCSGCHVGGNQGGLTLNSYTSLMQGGNSGAVVVAGDPDNSRIIQRLEGTVTPRMPFQQPPLLPGDIQLIRDWISQGAHDN